MAHESYIFESLLEKNVNLDDCKQWLLDSNHKPPDEMFEGFGWDLADREAFRKELPLLLINFIRGQSAKILHSSQDCSKTPAKPSLPTKYDYKSPIKTLQPSDTSNQKRGSKKRVQLFASPIKDSSRSTQLAQSNFESSDSVSIPDDFIKLKLTDRNGAKIETLNERLSARDDFNTPKLKIGQQTSKPVRKSLDLPNTSSQKYGPQNGQQFNSYTPQNSRNHSGGLMLGDFIVKSSSGSKKSKGKNRNRRNDTPLLNLKSESPQPSTPPSLGRTELAELESSPLTERLIKKSTKVPSSSNLLTEDQQIEPDKTSLNVSIENLSIDETKKPPTEKTPLKMLKFNLEENPDEDFSPLKNFIRPDFKENSTPSSDFIDPDPSKVTQSSKLAQLSSLYSFLIDKHLVPNVLVEMYLLLELLTVKARNEDNDISGFFNTVHNAVFFATEVIKQQVDLFKFVDVLTLKYLVSNPRLELFCPEVKMKLEAFLAISAQRPGEVHPLVPNNHLHSVRFQSDTDAKENFPNLNTFQDFKKQRDLFYNILRDWQHKTSGSEIPPKEVFVPRASRLLSLQSHPVNMIHFSKLFQDQLITMSLAEMNSLDGNDAAKRAGSTIVKKLETLNPEHWRKIQAKTYIPTRFGGPCPAPDFPGCQEFFRDFIRYCDGHLPFIAHLKLVFVRTITETTEKIIADRNRHQSSSIKSHPDSLTQDNCLSSEDLFNSILSLRIVGKFLGFLEFLPYHFQPDIVSEKILAQTLQARDKENPCIDIFDQLEKAEKSGNLVLTVPWIIEFCSVMDSVSVKLPYYKELFKRLVFVYMEVLVNKFQTGMKDQTNPLMAIDESEDRGRPINSTMTNFNAFFLTIHMGWFFEGALFPRELFLLNTTHQLELHHPAPCGLDSQNYVSPTLLYACCPYLNELMAILTQFETGFKTRSTQATEHLKAENENRESKLFRSAEKNPSREHSDIERSKTLSELQVELEENFFHNQSNSVRKCVESVAELVSSKITRMIARDVIDPEVLRVSKELQANLAVFLPEMTNSSMIQTIKGEMLSQVMDFAEKSYEDVKKKVNGIVSEKVSESCSTAVRLLLPDDTNQTVAELCVLVAQKKTLMFITARVKKNVTKDFFEKEFGREFEKFWRAALKRATDGTLKEPTLLPRVNIDQEDSISDDLFTCHVLVKIKDQIVMAIETKGASCQFSESVLDLLCQLETSLAQEIIFYGDNASEYEQTLKGVESLTVDWAIILCAFFPGLFTPEFQDAMVAFWGGPRVTNKGTHVSLSQPPSQLLSILSPRNMTFFEESPKPTETWRKFESFLGRLLSANLVLPEAMEDQSIRLLKSNWPLTSLRRLASCLNGIVSTLRAKPSFKNHDFLEWTAWFCAEVADDYDDGYNGNDDFYPPL